MEEQTRRPPIRGLLRGDLKPQIAVESLTTVRVGSTSSAYSAKAREAVAQKGFAGVVNPANVASHRGAFQNSAFLAGNSLTPISGPTSLPRLPLARGVVQSRAFSWLFLTLIDFGGSDDGDECVMNNLD